MVNRTSDVFKFQMVTSHVFTLFVLRHLFWALVVRHLDACLLARSLVYDVYTHKKVIIVIGQTCFVEKTGRAKKNICHWCIVPYT